MAILATERWDGRRFSRGSNAIRAFDVSGAADEDEAIAKVIADFNCTPRTAILGSGSPHPLDARLVVRPEADDGVVCDGHPKLRKVTVTYERRPELVEDAEIAALLAEPWQVEPDDLDETEDVTKDGAGRPIVSSGGQPFDAPFEGVRTYFTLKLTRWEFFYDAALAIAYKNRVNLDAITLPAAGVVQPGQCLFRKLACKGFTAGFGPVQVTYELDIRPLIEISDGEGGTSELHGFFRRVLDKGTIGSRNGNGFGKIVYDVGPDEGRPVDDPVLLNGRGVPLQSYYRVGEILNGDNSGLEPPSPIDVTSDGVWLMYDPTRGGANFSGLLLEANNA